MSLAAAMRGDDVLRGVVGPVPGPDGAVRGVGGEWQHERVTTSAPAMIGRDADLAMLNERLAEVRAGAPFTVIIGGEAGIGKTRLIREFEAGLPDDVRLLAGQSVDLGSVAAPYAPVKTALRTLLAEVGAQRMLDAVGPGRAALIALLPELVSDEASVATCNLTTAECEATINDARVSDVSVTHEFYGKSFAQRLRVDAGRRVGDPQSYSITQAGQQALCVDVPVVGGTNSYCALSNGVLARYDGNDLFIEMTAYSEFADETAFETSLPETTLAPPDAATSVPAGG